MKRSLLAALVSLGVAVTPLAPLSAQGHDVVAVLSSGAAPYQEALDGFKESYGDPCTILNMADGEIRLPAEARIIITFGGKAALYPYPAHTTLIYALAPGIAVRRDRHNGPNINIRVDAEPDIMMATLKAVQPNLRRLALFWVSPFFKDNFDDLQRVARAHGIEILGIKLESIDELPNKLRVLLGQADAIYLVPDPALITPGAFAVAKEFGRSNNLPLYVPLDSLVDKGASASIAPSFKEMGRAAGKLAAQAKAGSLRETAIIHPAKCYLTLNLTAAAQSGLQIPADVVKRADRVIP